MSPVNCHLATGERATHVLPPIISCPASKSCGCSLRRSDGCSRGLEGRSITTTLCPRLADDTTPVSGLWQGDNPGILEYLHGSGQRGRETSGDEQIGRASCRERV